eukprot:793340-Amphidinium_carterae.2
MEPKLSVLRGKMFTTKFSHTHPWQPTREVIAVQEDNAIIARQAVGRRLAAMVYQELKFRSEVAQAPLQFIACREIMGKTPRKHITSASRHGVFDIYQ